MAYPEYYSVSKPRKSRLFSPQTRSVRVQQQPSRLLQVVSPQKQVSNLKNSQFRESIWAGRCSPDTGKPNLGQQSCHPSRLLKDNQGRTSRLASPTRNFKPFKFADYSRPILSTASRIAESSSRLTPVQHVYTGSSENGFNVARESMIRTRMLFEDIHKGRNFSLDRFA